jgi:hypothetical protein
MIEDGTPVYVCVVNTSVALHSLPLDVWGPFVRGFLRVEVTPQESDLARVSFLWSKDPVNVPHQQQLLETVGFYFPPGDPSP